MSSVWLPGRGSRVRLRLDVPALSSLLHGMDQQEWMTSAEIARTVGVTRQTVTRWIRDGRLRAVRVQVGQRALYRVRPSAFREFVRRYVRDE